MPFFTTIHYIIELKDHLGLDKFDVEGISGGVSSIKPSKVKEAMDLITNRLLMMASIEGYVYEIYITYDIVEAMPLVGLQAPPE